jgi:hypothetical protein
MIELTKSSRRVKEESMLTRNNSLDYEESGVGEKDAATSGDSNRY